MKKNKALNYIPSKGQVVIYKSPEGDTNIDVKLEEETVWLSQKLMSNLFQKDSDTIGLHIKNIFKEKELEEELTTEYFSVVQKEGNRRVKRNIKYYNLDVIISVGYRVKSKRGTQFRIWATKILKDYLIKGYALNEKRLKEQTEKVKELEKSIETIYNYFFPSFCTLHSKLLFLPNLILNCNHPLNFTLH